MLYKSHIKSLIILLSIVCFAIIISSCNKEKSSDGEAKLIFSGDDVIYIDKNTDPLIEWAVEELASDIEKITGKKPIINKGNQDSIRSGIIIGKFNNSA